MPFPGACADWGIAFRLYAGYKRHFTITQSLRHGLRPCHLPLTREAKNAAAVPPPFDKGGRNAAAILLRFPRHQPFTAPTVRPEMKYFWKNGYAQAMGTTMTAAMAMRTDSDGIWARYCCRLRPAVGLLAM